MIPEEKISTIRNPSVLKNVHMSPMYNPPQDSKMIRMIGTTTTHMIKTMIIRERWNMKR